MLRRRHEPSYSAPTDCHFRLQDERKPYPRSSCAACGKSVFTGLGTHCTFTPPAAGVVPLHDGPPVSDVPAMLRRTADDIDAGRVPDVGAAFLVIPRRDDWPRVFGFGDVTGCDDPIVVFECAKAWFVQNIVRRG